MKLTVLCLLLLIGSSSFFMWRSPKSYRISNGCTDTTGILTMKQYRLVRDSHPRPFIINTGDMLIYGSTHTKNPDDFQIKDIEEKWEKFKPTVLLIEGKLGFLMPGLMNPVKKYGENGKAFQLAQKNNIKTYSWDLDKDTLMKKLVNIFSVEKVALKEILNPYFSNLRFGKPTDPEKYVSQFLSRARYVNQENNIKTIEDIDRIWKRDFPGIDWREESDHDMLPGYLQDIADTTQWFRNIHLVCVLKELKSKGEKIFVVAGSSHAVCIEKALQ